MAHEPSTPVAAGHEEPRIPPSAAPLFSPRQIVIATLLATPVAGGLLFAWNLRRLARPTAPVPLLAAIAAIAGAVWLDENWSTAVWWLAVPAWTMAFGTASSARFDRALAQVGERSGAVVLAVCVATLLALFGAGVGLSQVAPRAVPTFAEVLFDAVGVDRSLVRWRNGASRDDALRIGDAIARSGLVRENARLAVSVERPDGRLVLNVHLPDASPSSVAAARGLTRAVVDHLDHPECVTGRIIGPQRQVLASGEACPVQPR